MSNRSEELHILLSKKEKEFIIRSAADKCLSTEDFIILSALALEVSPNISKESLDAVLLRS